MPDRRTFVLSRAGFAGIQRYAANWMGDNQSRAGTTCGSASRWRWASACRARPSSAPTSAASSGHSNAELFLRWMQYGTLTPFCRNHSEIGNVDQYAWAWGETIARPRPRGDPAALPAAALPLRRVPARRRDGRARCSGRSSSTTSTTRRCATSTTSTCSAPTCSSRRSSRPGETARQVYLPDGRLVRLAHRRGAREGARYVLAPTPMDRIPLYARGGAVDPDVAGGAAVDRRPPSRGDRAAPLRPAGATARTARCCRRTTASRRGARRRAVPHDVRGDAAAATA